MIEAYWAIAGTRLGMTSVFVVDEHGCYLNTEPACLVPDRYANWFLSWLKEQPCPYVSMDLVQHVPCLVPIKPARREPACVCPLDRCLVHEEVAGSGAKSSDERGEKNRGESGHG